MDKTWYVNDIPHWNATIEDTWKLMQLLGRHGVPCSDARVEMFARRNSTSQENRVIGLQDAIVKFQFDTKEPLNITFQIGKDKSNYTTAGYLLWLLKYRSTFELVKQLFLEHVENSEEAWVAHVLSLGSVQSAVKKEFTLTN